MSQILLATPASRFQVIFKDALEEYRKRTKHDLTAHPLVARLELCSTPSTILDVLQDQVRELDQSRSSNEKLRKWLDPTVTVLHALSTTLGQVAGQAFSPAKPVFAAIGVLLIVSTRLIYNNAETDIHQAAREVRPNQDALIDLFWRISNLLSRLETYCKIKPTAAMADTIMKIMIEILFIFSIATSEIKGRKLKRFFMKLAGSSEIEDALIKLDKLTQEETRMAIAQMLKATYGIVDRVETVSEASQEVKQIMERTAMDVKYAQRDQIRKDLRTWLSPPDPSTNHNIACRIRHKGTATWFLEGSVFEEWKTTVPFLWITGKLGSGKSTFCSAIVKNIMELCKSGPALMAYFYFDFGDVDKQTYRGLLLSLLTQLSARSDSCCDILSHLFRDHFSGAEQPSDENVMQCLEKMLSLTAHYPTYLIMDALDECSDTSEFPSERDRVLQLLKDIIALRHPNVHICVTSRPEVDLRIALASLTSCAVSLHDQRGQKRDIEEYITYVINSDPKMMKWRDEDKALVIETLAQRADGMFKWVSCQLEILRHCLPQSLRQTLNELPESLDETYERILKNIKKPSQVHAHRLLQCLAVAFRRLYVEELGEVLAVDFDHVGGIPKLNPDWRWEDQEQNVLSACSSLVTVVNVSGSNRRIIQLSHLSVREYLTSNRLATSSRELSRYYILPKAAHETLALACMGILFGMDEQVDGLTIDQYPLLEYSAQYCIDHAQLGSSKRIQDAIGHLFDPKQRHFRLWIRVHDLDFEEFWPISSWDSVPLLDAPAAIYYAALCGFRDLVDQLLSKYPQHVNDKGGTHGTVLHAASRRNYHEIVQTIVEHGGDVNARGRCGKTPLHVAAVAGHLETAKWLLEHDAFVNAEDDERRNPLHLLAHLGGLDHLLSRSRLGHDTFPNTRTLGPPHGDQLVEVARLLLEHGVNADAKDESGRTVFEIASMRNFYDLMKLLPEYNNSIG